MFKPFNSTLLKVLGIVGGLLAAAAAAGAVTILIQHKNATIENLRAQIQARDAMEQSEEAEDVFEPVKVDRHYPLAGYKILLKDDTFGQIWIPVLEDVKLSEHPNELLQADGDRMYSYDEDGNKNAISGIDISSHNKVTDWEAVRAEGIDFVMLRVGYRTYGGGILHEDDKFEQYYRGAKAAGLKIGAYFFSQAVTEEEAVEEAALTVKKLKGHELDYPVAFDWEIIFDSADGARTDNVPVDVLTDLTLAYCQNIEAAGYRPMIYQGKRTSLFKYDLPRLQGIPFWLAEYFGKPTYIYNFDMWQYSCTGKINGVEGKVDLNLSFFDKPEPDQPDSSDESSDSAESSAEDSGSESSNESSDSAKDSKSESSKKDESSKKSH